MSNRRHSVNNVKGSFSSCLTDIYCCDGRPSTTQREETDEDSEKYGKAIASSVRSILRVVIEFFVDPDGSEHESVTVADINCSEEEAKGKTVCISLLNSCESDLREETGIIIDLELFLTE